MTSGLRRKEPETGAGYTVRIADEDDANGVSSILGTLLSQNFENFPDRVKIARRVHRPVAVYSTDTQTSATVFFGHDRAVIRNGLIGKPSVIVQAEVNQILDVAQLKMAGRGLVPLGFFTKRGAHVLRDIGCHRLVVTGLLTHTLSSLRFIALVSIAE